MFRELVDLTCQLAFDDSTCAMLLDIAEGGRSLRRLKLCHSSVERMAKLRAVAKAIARHGSLRHLTIWHVGVDTLREEHLEELARCGGLETLDLGVYAGVQAKVTDESVAKLLERLPQLQHLSLRLSFNGNTPLTLHSVDLAVQKGPLLEQLCLFVDASTEKIPPTPSRACPAHQNLQVLDFGCVGDVDSSTDMEAIDMVVAYLRPIIPDPYG